MMNEKNTVRVWDVAVRVFHWSLVFFVLAAFLSGDDAESFHAFAGYAVSALLVFRFVWGFVGTRYARFSDFVYGPTEIAAYLKGFLSGTSKHYIGHNPAGGLMIVVLLLSLTATCWTGFKAYGEEGHGFLADSGGGISLVSTAYADDDHDDDDDDDRHKSKKNRKGTKKSEGHELWEETHEFFAGLTLALVLVHLAGVLVTTFHHREHLIRAMITGRKPLR